MIQVRIVAPPDAAANAFALLSGTPGVCNLIHLPGVASRPDGDVIICDVPREEASVILADLRELDIHRTGSIALESIDSQLSAAAAAAEAAVPGLPGDAVIWEQVEERTSAEAELSATFLSFMALAMLISAVGIFLDSPILIIGAMIVGPEFGPIAGFCVAAVAGRRAVARRSFLALAVGFPFGITVTWLITLLFIWTGATPDTFDESSHSLATIISSPDFFSFFVAFCAGVAGMLSLTSAKSGALIGVLISVTTIPAAANIAVSAAYGDWSSWRGSMATLAINLACILVAGITTLGLQRWIYRRRRRAHMRDPVRASAGLPVGRRAGRAGAAGARTEESARVVAREPGGRGGA